ncbi:zinc ribbon domain-containing protein [Frankia sp. Cppng1_Ct_nod]|uniref:zinc ribbon domain-containing protein n=1 Tax=Frankia sp. Cppng1_Ct_nod TaxID=2897162 RepID=UPI00104184ED|nr:zinc ribbon domain-containing protein [Frankia sp. Cppng1_Ct_nod]
MTNVESLDVESSGRGADGPWLTCPWCGGIVPLAHLVPADEEPDARVAVCDSCGRRVEFLSPTDPTA